MTNIDDRDLDAGEYVLGTLPEDARGRFSAELEQDPALEALVAKWGERLNGLDDSEVTQKPRPGVWEAINARIDTLSSDAAPTVTIASDEGEWVTLADGVEKKTLLRDQARGEESFLLRISSGTELDGHDHKMTEECLLLEGDLSIGDIHMKAGDYHAALAGTAHPQISSVGGAVLYVRGEIRDAA